MVFINFNQTWHATAYNDEKQAYENCGYDNY